jgi:general secretion pathway protein A
MYKDFFGFLDEPFAIESGPQLPFLTEKNKEVLNSLIYGIANKKEFMLLTGEKGTGKTTLINHLINILEKKVKVVFIHQNCKTIEEILEIVLIDLGLPNQERNRSLMTVQLEDYLIQRSALNETTVIIIDEAQNLSKETLEELRLLANPNPRRPKYLQEILVGDSGIEEILNSYGLRSLQQRIEVRGRLHAFSQSDCRQYIQHRLGRVGSKISDIFSLESADLICRYSGGIPQVINMFCYIALSAAYATSQKKVDAAIVEAVFSILAKQKATKRQRRESPIVGFTHFLANSPLIMKISYVLLSYSLLAWVILFSFPLE